MLFSFVKQNFSVINSLGQTNVMTLSSRFFYGSRALNNVLTRISIVALVLSVLSMVNTSLAQTTNAKIATLEETSGSSIREFNALRALDPKYLDNPDGKEMPVDKDDLWLPEMSLGKKNPSTNAGVRIISYNNGKTTTETRTAQTVSPSASNLSNSKASKILSAEHTTNSTTAARASSANYVDNKKASIRQINGGFDNYTLNTNLESIPTSEGFANYQLSGSETPYVAMREDENNTSPFPTEPVSSDTNGATDFEDINDFPTANLILGDFPVVDNDFQNVAGAATSNNNNTTLTTSNGQSSFDANFANTLYSPQINTGLDDLLSNTTPQIPSSESSTSSIINITPSIPQDTVDNFPEADLSDLNLASQNPLDSVYTDSPSQVPSMDAIQSSKPEVTETTSTYEETSDSVVEPLPYETPGMVMSAEGEEYMPIDLLSEPESDHTILNGTEEPFRESFRVTPKTPSREVELIDSEKQMKSLETAPLSESQLKNLTIEDVRISGLEMTAQQFNKIVKTRIGAKFSQQRLEEDKRALLQTKQFIDVTVSTSWSADKPDKVIVNFDLTPRRMMRYIKVVGNRKISKHDILEELGLRPGESRMDPYEVENGRLRIIEFYKSKEYGEPHVEILRGDRPEDVGVVYLIDEGLHQRVLKTKFVGNSIVSSARLHSLVSVKPGILYFIGGTFTRERLDADVEKLLEYYRNLGYFDARIDREYEESKWFGGLGKDNSWVSVRYIIDEGPRYKIRNFYFNGNRVVPAKDLEAKLKVKPGSYYRFDEIEADRIALRYKYQDLGYVRADVTPNQIFTDKVGEVDIRYDVSEGHRYRVRDVIVDYVGTESRTMTPVVLNMLDITPGELLNGKKIRMSENTLRQSGYFNDKPSEGQLPEIAVIPDETRIYKLNRQGRAELVNENTGEDEKGVQTSLRENDATNTTRGQTSEDTTRGQVDDVANHYASYAPYVSYEDAQKKTQAKDSNSKFISYGPSETTSDKTVRSPVTLSTLNNGDARRDSLVRGQARQIPSGFSTVKVETTENASAGTGSYQPYDSTNQTSQYTENLDYANMLNSNAGTYNSYGTSAQGGFISTDDSSAPGFSDGVYGSIGKEVLEPITPETDDIYDGDVLVKVQEGRTGMFQASIGVNSDYGLVGNVSFTERNFDLFRLPTSLCRLDGWKDAFRGGGQIFSVQASPGTSVQSYRMSWDVPYVFNTKYLFGITGLYGEHSFDEWFESRYGGEIRVGRQWSPRFSTTVNAGMYNVKIKDPAVSFVPDLNEVVGTNRMYTVGLTAAYDTRNHPYSPSAGYLLKGTGEVGLGDYSFPRLTLDGRYYKTLHKRVDGTGRWVLGFSSHLGWTGSDTPIYERYFGGGSQNLRGFEYREVTPRYKATGFGIGGKYEFYNTVEFFVPVSGGDEFQLAFFVDTGTVAESMKKWGRYRVAPGFGLRFTIPMLGPAPLALDFAFPISKDPSDVTEVFTFNLSGSR